MPSGEFTSFPIDQIFVNRTARQRRELDPAGIRELADSIAKIGQIHPIVIQRSGELRVGERRFEAVKLLGHTHILAQFVEDLDDHELQLLELEENVKRVNLAWQDQVDAVERYHALRAKADPEWTQTKTAEALGQSMQAIGYTLAVAKEIKRGNEKVAKAEKFSVARGIVERATKRRTESTLAVISGDTPPEAREVPLANLDFHQFAKGYSGHRFNFIHCDFPYGINADNQAQGTNVQAFEAYKDDPESYWSLIKSLAECMDNVVAPSAHIMFWFSMSYYAPTLAALTDMGWRVDPFPLVWHKSDNVGLLPDPKRGPRRTYETAFVGSRGDRLIASPVANSFSSPTTKRIGMSEKPLAVLRHFFRMFVDENTLILDPTAGSGNAIRAATSANFRLGLERDPTIFAAAKEHFYDLDE